MLLMDLWDSTVSDPDLPPAGLFRRLAAAGYDCLLLAALFMLYASLVVLSRGGDPVPAGNIVFQLTLLGIAAVFFTGFWSRGGQTLGMRAWRLRVESRSGKGIGAGTSLLRFAGVLVSISVFGLGFLWLLVDRDKLSWHDRLAGTRVVVLPKGEDPTTWRAPVQPG